MATANDSHSDTDDEDDEVDDEQNDEDDVHMECDIEGDFTEAEVVLQGLDEPQVLPVSPNGESDGHHSQVWHGYKLVGDNIDRNVHPAFERKEHMTCSLHYFHSYGVLDELILVV